MRGFSALNLKHRPAAESMLVLAIRSPSGRAPPLSVTDPAILPTLFSEGCRLYPIRNGPFFLSLLAHFLDIVVLLTSSSYLVTHRREVRQQIMQRVPVLVQIKVEITFRLFQYFDRHTSEHRLLDGSEHGCLISQVLSVTRSDRALPIAAILTAGAASGSGTTSISFPRSPTMVMVRQQESHSQK